MYLRFGKRVLDLSLSVLALLLLLPVIFLIAVLVYVKLGAPVLFKQRRPGKGEQLFTLYKFRTMTEARDKDGVSLPDEIRLTRFGKWLRSTSLDELPELWNILKGDMSIVGPRPLLEAYLPLYSDEQKQRHKVQPGLTGLAQVNGRNAIGWEEKFVFDVLYTKQVSLKMDVDIIYKTFVKVVRREDINNGDCETMTLFSGNAVEDDTHV